MIRFFQWSNRTNPSYKYRVIRGDRVYRNNTCIGVVNEDMLPKTVSGILTLKG